MCTRPTFAALLGALFVLLVAQCPAALASDPTPALPMASATLTYDGASISNLDGGLRRATAYNNNLEIAGMLNAAQAFGWTGTSIYASAMWISGGQPDTFIGDALGVSNISAPSGTQMEELWVQRNFNHPNVSVLAGLYDLNSEFYVVESGSLFLNSAFGIGPEFADSGVRGPSIFPRTSVGLRVSYKPRPGVILRAAALDGVPLIRPHNQIGAFQPGDGLLYVAELALVDRPGNDVPTKRRRLIGRLSALQAYRSKIAFGVWHYTSTFTRIDSSASSTKQHGATGVYAVGDTVVARDRSNPDRSLSAFVQLGLGDPLVNRFARYYGVGLVANGPFPGRSNDQLGLALAVASNGTPYQRLLAGTAGEAHKESTVELSYLAQLAPWLAIQPDLQYVILPNANRNIPNALVFTLRFEINLGSF